MAAIMPGSVAVPDSTSNSPAALPPTGPALARNSGVVTAPVTVMTRSCVLVVSCAKVNPLVSEVMLLDKVGTTGWPLLKSTIVYCVPLLSVTPLATRIRTCSAAGNCDMPIIPLYDARIQPAVLPPAVQLVCPPAAVMVLTRARVPPAPVLKRALFVVNALPCRSSVEIFPVFGAFQSKLLEAVISPPNTTVAL